MPHVLEKMFPATFAILTAIFMHGSWSQIIGNRD
jgi:hypothetical protein